MTGLVLEPQLTEMRKKNDKIYSSNDGAEDVSSVVLPASSVPRVGKTCVVFPILEMKDILLRVHGNFILK
jgi:hypothetical protein